MSCMVKTRPTSGIGVSCALRTRPSVRVSSTLEGWLALYAARYPAAPPEELTARGVSSRSPGGSFGRFARTVAGAGAVCTRHYRVDWSLGIYDEETRRIDKWKGLKVLRKFFFAERKSLLRQFRTPGSARGASSNRRPR